MMSSGFIFTLNDRLAQFKDESRREEYKDFMLALVQWRTCQMIVGMLREGITDFRAFTPRGLDTRFLDPERDHVAIRERLDVNQWEGDYYRSYENLYTMYTRIARTFPKETQGIFFMHDDPPTSLFNHIYRQFFPDEPIEIATKYKDRRQIVW